MPDRAAMAVWCSRLRWRLSGAWQWPTFTVLTVAGAVVLARLPFAGGRGSLLGCFLAAGLLNLAAIVVMSRLGGWLLRRLRPHLPREVAADQAAAVGMVALWMVLVGAGIAHRPALVAGDDALASAVHEARVLAAHRAPARYLPLHGSDTWQQGPHLFRTCFAGPDPRRDFCVVVRTDEPVAIKRVDPDQRPNATIAGSNNPGR
jgi:hypothetical protein